MKNELPFNYDIVLDYANDRSASRLIRQCSVVFLFWAWLIILPFVVWSNYISINYVLVSSAATTSIVALVALLITNRSRKLAVLFFGIESFFMSIIHLLLVVRMLYFEAGYNSDFVIIVCILGYIIMFCSLSYYHYHALKSDKYRKSKQKAAVMGSIIPIASAFGIAIGKSLKGAEQNTVVIAIAACFTFFVFVFLFGSHNIYKYLLIRKYKIELKK